MATKRAFRLWQMTLLLIVLLLFMATEGCQKKDQHEKDGQAEEQVDTKKVTDDAKNKLFSGRAAQSGDTWEAGALGLEGLLDVSSLKTSEQIPAMTGYTRLGEGKTWQERKHVSNERYYRILSFNKVYGTKLVPPPIDYNMDLSDRSLEDLIYLRNEVFAHQGYLFSNATIRGYFNQFKWYQPIFWEGERKIELTSEEQMFVNRVKREEEERLKQNYRLAGESKLACFRNVVNRAQFKEIPEVLSTALNNRNFAVVEAKHQELYHLYDRNMYEGIPSYVTTDLLQRLLNVHYKYLLMDIEREEMLPLFERVIGGLFKEMNTLYRDTTIAPELLEAVEFNMIYLGIAGNMLTPGSCTIPEALFPIYSGIYNSAYTGTGTGVDYFEADFYDFTQLQPRGSYDALPELMRYFRAVKWLNTMPLFLDRDRSLLASALLGLMVELNPGLANDYQRIEEVTALFAGEGDNLSLLHMRQALQKYAPGRKPTELVDQDLHRLLRHELANNDNVRIKPRSTESAIEHDMNRLQILFTPSRYSFDSEILQRLMVEERPLPMALDIFAVAQGGEAERILLEEYKVQQEWSSFPDTITALRKSVLPTIDWNSSLYNKRMELLFTLNHVHPDWPDFMKGMRWTRRNLIASITGWTQLKHEMILYLKQPMYAEGGEGGGPPPPIIPGYVEPHVEFWAKAMELLEGSRQCLTRHEMISDHRMSYLVRTYEIADFCHRMAVKELAGKHLTDSEMETIQWMGGRVEHLMADIIPDVIQEERMQIVTDVATRLIYNISLQEAIGYGDEIYVLAEINGRLYLTRGAVMSHYEFHHTTTNRMTDDKWRGTLEGRDGATKRPVWTEQTRIESRTLVAKPNYGDHSGPYSMSGW